LQTDYSALSPLFWEKVIEKNPQFRDAYVMLGEVYLKTSQNNPQNLTKAQQKLEKAAEIDPVYPKTYQLLAQVYEKIGAEENVERAKSKIEILK
jgi:Tfp pilus assembly protein PilF